MEYYTIIFIVQRRNSNYPKLRKMLNLRYACDPNPSRLN